MQLQAIHTNALQTRAFFGRDPLPVAGSGRRSGANSNANSTAVPHSRAQSSVPELPSNAPPSHMFDGPVRDAPRYNAVSKAMSVMSGMTGGATGAPGGISTRTESPYQAVNTRDLDGDTAVQGRTGTMETPVDTGDPVAVLHAQLDHHEKYRGGVVLGKYR